MKQTNNALKFLLAQYRAIFKHAYLKGLVTAVALTAGFTAVSAQAEDSVTSEGFLIAAGANNGLTTEQLVKIKDDISISGSVTIGQETLSTGQRLYAKSISIENGGKLSVTLNSDEHMMFNGLLKVGSGAEFTVTGDSSADNTHVNGAIKENPTMGDLTFNDFTGDFQLEAGGKTTLKDTHIEVHNAYINGGTLDISKSNAGTSWDLNSGLIAGGADAGSTFEIKGNATINLGLGAALTSEVETTLNVGPSTINMAGGDTANYSSFILAKDTVNFNSGSTVNVSGSGTGIYGKTVNLNSGSKIDIASAGVLNLDGALTTDQADGSTRDAGTITVNGATITNAGTLNLGSSNDTTFTVKAGTITNSGILNINADADFGSSLTNTGKMVIATGTTTTTTATSLGVTGTGTGQVSVAKDATLVLTDSAITFTEGDFADSIDDVNGNFQYGKGNILNAGTIDASSAKVTFTSNGAHENQGGNNNNNVLFMDGGELIVGSLDVEQKAIQGAIPDSKIEDFVVLGGTLTVKGDITADKGDIKVFAIDGENGTMNLDNTSSSVNTLTDVNRFRVFAADEAQDDAGAVLNISGAWDFNGAGVRVSYLGTTNFNQATVTDAGLINLTKSESAVNLIDSTVTASSLYLENGDGTTVDAGALSLNNSTLEITGKVGANVSDSINLTNNSTLKMTYAAANAEKGTTDTDASDDGLGADVLTGDSTSSLILTGYQNAEGGNSLTLEQYQSIKSSFLDEGFSGSFGLEGVTVTDAGIENGEVAFDQAQSAGGLTGVYTEATVTGVTGDVTGTHDWGKAELADNQTNLSVGQNATIELNGTGDVVTTSDGKQAGVQLAAGSTVGLNGTNATVGAITASAAGEGTVQTAGSVTVKSIGSATAAINEVKVLGTSAVTLQGDIYTKTLSVASNGSVNMDGKNIFIVQDGSGTPDQAVAEVAGSVTNAGTVSASGSVTVTGQMDADSFKFTQSGLFLTVGAEDASASVNLKSVDLNGGTLRFDPDYDQKVSANGVATDTAVDKFATTNGKLEIQRNNIVGIGATGEEAYAVASRYVNFDPTDGSLIEDQIGAVLYQDTHYSIETGYGLVVSAAQDTFTANTFDLKSNTAWILSGALVDDCTNSMYGAIVFANSTGTVNLADDSKIIFDGGSFLASDTVTLFSALSSLTVNDNGTEIVAGNGMLTGSLNTTNGTVSFSLAQDAGDYLYAQSNPVKELTLNVIGNQNNSYDIGEIGVGYIAAINAHNGGAAVEETARLAVYGGAVQSAYLAQQTSTDAVAERLSIASPNSNLVSANNQNGGGLWLAPVYKNHDSDGFEAQGVNYGSDIDLTGVALGADFTTESGVRVGGYFNLGSGDADGQGISSDISNDFDYFGMGLYAGMKFGNFGFAVDAGFTQVSNDLEQNVGYNEIGKITADTDATAVTLGLRGDYLLNLGMVDVTPHVGLRYTNLSLDAYDAKLDGYTVATTDADSMDIFSIPFGVTVSTDLQMGSWTVQPVFDLTLTANAGDTDFDTTTTFIGTQGLNLSSEVLDSFTYGATLGIGAKYNESLSVGIGVNYTGSSNADELGVTAHTRFVF